jgi:tetratricopeptide (TPR) repeat protein
MVSLQPGHFDENLILLSAPYIRAVQLSPTNLKGWLHLAHLAQLHKKYNMAWQMYNSVLALDPQCVAAWEGRALNHVDLGNFDAAMEDAQNAMVMLYSSHRE